MAMSIRGAERSEGIARRAEQAVQRCTAERRKPFGGNLAEGDPKGAQAGARPMCGKSSTHQPSSCTTPTTRPRISGARSTAPAAIYPESDCTSLAKDSDVRRQ